MVLLDLELWIESHPPSARRICAASKARTRSLNCWCGAWFTRWGIVIASTERTCGGSPILSSVLGRRLFLSMDASGMVTPTLPVQTGETLKATSPIGCQRFQTTSRSWKRQGGKCSQSGSVKPLIGKLWRKLSSASLRGHKVAQQDRG
jgi:hypothetical protein